MSTNINALFHDSVQLYIGQRMVIDFHGVAEHKLFRDHESTSITLASG